ncbi:MAG: hypothetical protein M3382_06125 [Thermoproteota archaeon]|nr:hypothetical protein [Thermoproteota archaeon]
MDTFMRIEVIRKIMNNLKLVMPMIQQLSKKLRMENIGMRQALAETATGEEMEEEHH